MEEEGLDQALYQLQSMEVSFEEAGEKGRRTRMLLGFFTVVETIMICFADQIFFASFLTSVPLTFIDIIMRQIGNFYL